MAWCARVHTRYTREIERVKRETKVGGKEEDPTEDPTAASEEPMEHGG